MTKDKREDPLLRAGRRAKRAAADAVRRGQAGATDETRAAAELVDARPRLPPEALGVDSILFTPGAGGVPRHIAGRREMRVLGRILRALMRGAVRRHDAVLHAPDGSARRWLDRALVVPVLGLEDAAFFELPE